MALREITMFGEKCKPEEAKRMLKYYEPLALEKDPRGFAVGFSGGKDSIVLAKIFQEAGVKHFYMYNITGLDAAELVFFKRKMFQQFRDKGYLCYDFMYEKNIIHMMEEHLTPPSRRMRYCCQELKEKRRSEIEGCLLSFGVRKFESNNRMARRNELEVYHGRKKVKIFSFDDNENRREFETCYSKGTPEIRVNPLAYWLNSDVWEFIHDRKIEYCCLYDEGFERLGCVGCPMAGKHREFEFQRFPYMKRIWEIGFQRMWDRRVSQGKGWWKGIKSISDLWDWWIEVNNTDEPMEGQMLMEEVEAYFAK